MSKANCHLSRIAMKQHIESPTFISNVKWKEINFLISLRVALPAASSCSATEKILVRFHRDEREWKKYEIWWRATHFCCWSKETVKIRSGERNFLSAERFNATNPSPISSPIINLLLRIGDDANCTALSTNGGATKQNYRERENCLIRLRMPHNFQNKLKSLSTGTPINSQNPSDVWLGSIYD